MQTSVNEKFTEVCCLIPLIVCIFVVEISSTLQRGRNKELIRQRDEALCRRYYYWTEVQRLRFDDALKVLSEKEFFISEERIMTIIRKMGGELKDIAVRPVPRVKKPRLTMRQLQLFGEPE
jgi:hypothetical protein